VSFAVVTASNRPDRLHAFAEAWEFPADVTWIVVADAPSVTEYEGLADVTFCWDDIPEWMPRRTDSIRSYGVWEAWKWGVDYTMFLDDDVLPVPGVDLFGEYERVFAEGAPVSDYLDVGALTSSGLQMRGFPHRERERRPVAVQYGGWAGVPDLDGATQIANPQVTDETFAPVAIPVPRGAAVTGCNMNMAWQARYAPIVWQLPLLDGRYNRYGDIWAGLLSKRACDSAGLAVVVNGKAQVRHERASDPQANLVKEAPGLALNETLWQALAAPTATNVVDAYQEATDSAASFFYDIDTDYADHFVHCRDEWLGLFEQ